MATDTFYPDADPETTTVDGRVWRESSGNWAAIRDGAGTNALPSSAGDGEVLSIESITTPNWRIVSHAIVLFDTSAIADTDTISAVTLSVVGNGATSTLTMTSGQSAVHAAASTPASDTNIVTADFQQVGRTTFGNIASASWDSGGTNYNDIAFNATGIAATSKTGVSKFSLQFGADINNDEPTYVASKQFSFGVKFAETAGTSADPKLTVVHAGATTNHFLSLMGAGT